MSTSFFKRLHNYNKPVQRSCLQAGRSATEYESNDTHAVCRDARISPVARQYAPAPVARTAVPISSSDGLLRKNMLKESITTRFSIYCCFGGFVPVNFFGLMVERPRSGYSGERVVAKVGDDQSHRPLRRSLLLE